jgi:hypothetical protein
LFVRGDYHELLLLALNVLPDFMKQCNQKMASSSADGFANIPNAIDIHQRMSGSSFAGFINPANLYEVNQRPSANAPGSYTNIPSLLDIKFQGPVPPGFAGATPALSDVPPPPVPVMSHPSVPPPPLPPRRLPVPHSSGLIPPNVPIGMAPPGSHSQPTGRLPPPPSITANPSVQPPFPVIGTIPNVGALGAQSMNDRQPLNINLHMNERPPMNINERVSMCVTDRQARNINEMQTVSLPPTVPPPDSSKYGAPYDYNSHQSGYYSTFPDAPSFPPQVTAPFASLSAENMPYDMGNTESVMSYVLSHAAEVIMNPPLPQDEIDRPPLPQDEVVDQPRMTKTARDREARQRKKERRKMEQATAPESNKAVANVAESIKNESKSDSSRDVIASSGGSQESDSKVDRSETSPEAKDGKAATIKSYVETVEIVDEDSEEPVKEYHFAWDNLDDECLSDVTVSSVHTSDLSSFDEDAEQVTQQTSDDIGGAAAADVSDETTAPVGSELQPSESENQGTGSPYSKHIIIFVIEEQLSRNVPDSSCCASSFIITVLTC